MQIQYYLRQKLTVLNKCWLVHLCYYNAIITSTVSCNFESHLSCYIIKNYQRFYNFLLLKSYKFFDTFFFTYISIKSDIAESIPEVIKMVALHFLAVFTWSRRPRSVQSKSNSFSRLVQAYCRHKSLPK